MKDYSNYYNVYSFKNYKLTQAQVLFNKQLEYEGQNILLQKNNIKAIVRNHGNPTSEYREERYVITSKDIEIQQGHIINYLNEDYLIITDIDRDNPIYNTCKMRKSTLYLSFLNSKGDICTYPVIEEGATKYSDGITNNNKVKLGDTQRVLAISLTDDTKDLKVGHRFLFDKNHAYEISFDGLNKENSLKEMMVTQVPINKDTDNFDLLIADYYGKAHEYKMEIFNKDIVLSAYEDYQLNIQIYDKDVKVDNPLIEYSINDDTIVKINNNTITGLKEGNTQITVKFKNLTEILNIKVESTNTPNDYTTEIIGKDSLALGKSSEYNAKFYMNGIEVLDEKAIWSLTDESNKETIYGKLIINGNKCTLIITDKWIFNNGYRQYVYLHCKSIKHNEIIKQIKITQL